jgi:sugar phosphate isomerase/epimerase
MNIPNLAWRLSPQLYAWRVRGKSTGSDLLPAFIHEGIADASYAGYDGVEFGLSVLRIPARIPALVKLLQSHGLALAALFCTISTGADDHSIETVVNHAITAPAIGCQFLIVATVQERRSSQNIPSRIENLNLSNTARIIESLGTRLAERDIHVCWHPHEEHLGNGGEGLLRVLNATRINHVGLCLDLGWILRVSEDPLSILNACNERLRWLHIRDLSDGVWCQAIGEGLLDLGAITDRLKQFRYAGWLSVELWFERNTRMTRSLRENARISSERLRSYFR